MQSQGINSILVSLLQRRLVYRSPPATHPPPGARRAHDPGSSWLWPHPYVTGGGAGGEARCSRRYIAATLGPQPAAAALAATLGPACSAVLASACGVLAATLGPARCATLARARSGGAGGDARPSPQWCAALAATLGLALPACSRRQRGSAQPAECGACGDSRRSSPSPSLARARVGGAGLYGAGRNARSGYTLPSQPAAVARGDARPRPRPRRWRRRSAQLAVALPGPHPQRRRWRGDARCRPPRLQRRRRRLAQPATAALAAMCRRR